MMIYEKSDLSLNPKQRCSCGPKKRVLDRSYFRYVSCRLCSLLFDPRPGEREAAKRGPFPLNAPEA